MSNIELDDLMNRRSPSQTKKGVVLDGVLVVLGGITIWLAGRYLKFDDPRPLYNAWTYVVLVPMGIVAVDLVLRTLVSYYIERTLQIAFLLSVLVHLLMTMGAVHLVLFAQSESDLPTLVLHAVSAQSQPSSIPEFFQTSDNPSLIRPDYMRPVPTSDSEASATQSEKQNIDHASSLKSTVDSPDSIIETPTMAIAKAEAKIDAPEITSTKIKLERPEPRKPTPEALPSIAIPTQKNPTESNALPSLEAKPNKIADTKQESDDRRASSALEPIDPMMLAPVEPRLQLSQAPRRKDRGDFELPAIEDRKTEIAKRDLSRGAASRIPEPTLSRVPLTDLPNDVEGELNNHLPATTLDRPTDLDDRLPMSGRRSSESSLGGTRSSAVLEGLAEAGTSQARPGIDGTKSKSSAIQRRPANPESIEIADIMSTITYDRSNTPTLSPSQTSIPIPNGSGGSQATENQEGTSSQLEASSVAAKRSVPSEMAGSSSTLKGPQLNLDEPQPTIDIRRTTGPSLASNGVKAKLPELEAWLDMPSLPGPKRPSRLPSARPSPNSPAVPIPAPAFQQRMARNDGSADSSELGEFGPATEAAIERGLEFLAKYQRSDGSWRLEDFDGKPRLRSHTAATALSLLAFQGAGYSHRQFHYAPVCKSAIEYLLAHQKPDGDLYIEMDEESNANARFYSHSIASLALCEAYGMTQDEALREPAQRAVRFMVKTQDPIGGGWRYQPGLESDTSVSGWFMMALKSAELAGLEVPKPTFEKIKGWLDKAQASPSERHLYRYNPLAPDTSTTRHGRVPNPTMTSVGLLMRLYLGWRRDTPELMLGADYLLENLPTEGTVEKPQRDTYYWYYATQVLFHMGGERWKRWNSQLHPMLISSQMLEGSQVGSWDPAGPIPDRWGPFAGRLYVTTLNLLSLEVFYRHLPIYEETAR